MQCSDGMQPSRSRGLAESRLILYDSAVPDTRYVIVGYQDHITRVWNTARGQFLAELPPMPSKMVGEFAAVLPVVSPDGSRAAIARANVVSSLTRPSAPTAHCSRLVVRMGWWVLGHGDWPRAVGTTRTRVARRRPALRRGRPRHTRVRGELALPARRSLERQPAGGDLVAGEDGLRERCAKAWHSVARRGSGRIARATRFRAVGRFTSILVGARTASRPSRAHSRNSARPHRPEA